VDDEKKEPETPCHQTDQNENEEYTHQRQDHEALPPGMTLGPEGRLRQPV